MELPNNELNVGEIGLLDTALMASAGICFAVQAHPMAVTLLTTVAIRTAWRWHKKSIIDFADHALVDSVKAYHAARNLPQTTRRIQQRVHEVVEQKQTATPATLPDTPDTTTDNLPHTETLVGWMAERHHILLIGHTRGGKTVLLHSLAREKAAQGAEVIVCDSDSIDGTYPGYSCVGGGDDYEAIAERIEYLRSTIDARRQQRKAGKRAFPELWMLLDEAHDIKNEIEGAWDVLENSIRRGAKLGIHLVIATQDDQVATLGLVGKSKLLINLTRVEAFKRGDNHILSFGKGGEVVLPELPNPDDTVTVSQRGPKVSKAEADALLVSLLNGSERSTVQPERSDRSNTVQTHSEDKEATTEELELTARTLEQYRKTQRESASIETIWGIKRGGSKEFVRARTLLRAALAGKLDVGTKEEQNQDLLDGYLGERKWAE
jgi:hypothetical protein